jgi:hypothetical protein
LYRKVKTNMHISPKPPEVLQAQLAAFTAERVAQPKDVEYLLGNISTLSATDPTDIRRITEAAEYPLDADGNKLRQNRIAPNTEITVATRSEYTAYLRSVNGSRHDAIRERSNLQAAYKELEPTVEALITDVDAEGSKQNHQAFVGDGANRMAFIFEYGDKKYIARVPQRGKETSPESIDADLQAYMLAKGQPHMEQVAGVSYDKDRLITEALPGKDLSKWNAVEVAEKTSDQQLKKLVKTVQNASHLRIGLDIKVSNFMYDTEADYNLIDFTLDKDGSPEDLLAENILGTATVLANTGNYEQFPATREAYMDAGRQLTAAVSVARRYAATVLETFENKEKARLLVKQIEENIADNSLLATRYSNPDWVKQALLPKPVKHVEASTAQTVPTQGDDLVA